MITIREDGNVEFRKTIHKRLRKNNIEKCDWYLQNISEDTSIPISEEHNFYAFDGEALIGGAVGFIQYNWYFLDWLIVEKEYRGQDIGTALIQKIEAWAKERNLTGVRLESWNFQAREFYEKNGYTVFGQIEDCPPGTVNYFLKKAF